MVIDPNEWECVNADTERLEVPGGYLYRVDHGDDSPPWIGFVAGTADAIRYATKWLGTGEASTPFGAMEAHASMLDKTGQRIAEALDGLDSVASALREVAEAVRERAE
jgi:hypothetical protein